MSKNEFAYMQKKYYRAKELAELLGVGLSTIWRYAKDGKITAYKLSGGVTVFNIEEVERDLLEVVQWVRMNDQATSSIY